MPDAAADNTLPLEERIELREPVVAGILAYLIPGAGHLYQRRYFKAAIYFFCIMGIYVIGSSLGEAKAVHCRFDRPEPGKTQYRSLGYIAQVGLGLPTLPAIVQQQRYESQELAREFEVPPEELVESFDCEFRGFMRHIHDGDAEVTGQLTGTLKGGDYGNVVFEGEFKGLSKQGEPVELALTGSGSPTGFSSTLQIGPKISGLDDVTLTYSAEDEAPERVFSADRRRFLVRIGTDAEAESDLGFLEGTIKRPLTDHYLVPLDDPALEHLYGRLGKHYEMALVYTWIAGLLNVLAVWDAVQGPAYGYGDEPVEDDKKDSQDSEKSKDAGSKGGDDSPAPAEAT